jgi:hypothetical protein
MLSGVHAERHLIRCESYNISSALHHKSPRASSNGIWFQDHCGISGINTSKCRADSIPESLQSMMSPETAK